MVYYFYVHIYYVESMVKNNILWFTMIYYGFTMVYHSERIPGIVYSICADGGEIVSEIVNTLNEHTQQDITETLQWPPVGH